MPRRSEARIGGSRGLALIVLLAAVALTAGVSVGIARASAAPGAPGAGPAGGGPVRSEPGTAVVYQVSAAAQRATLNFWTQARMREAQSAAVPQAAQRGLPAVQPPKGIPTAAHFTGVPTTGALFSTTGKQVHFCTASVSNSKAGDLILTAAHCVYWKTFATNVEYVPEYHNGHQPYGAWPVQSITVAANWKNGHDPDVDFAFLAVSNSSGRKIQAVTGGLNVGFTLWYSQKNIEVIGYNDTDSEPIKCATKSFRFRAGQMEFYCHGFWTGTSGGPWIIGFNAKTGTGTVFGDIGGYELGGDYDWASYSPYFGSQLRALYKEAVSAQAP